MAVRTGDTIFEVLVQVKSRPRIKKPAAFQIRTNMPVWERYNRNVPEKTRAGHVKTVHTKIGRQPAINNLHTLLFPV